MDAESWQELCRTPFPPPSPTAPHTPVTTLTFDTNQELVWAGNEFGRINSFYGGELQRYTSYRGHGMQEETVKNILPCEKGILSVGPRSVHFGERRGRAIWHLTNVEFEDLRCACHVGTGTSEILLAGCQSSMFKIDIEHGEIVETMPSQDHYTLLRRGGQYVCAATSTGSVSVLDSKTLEVLKTWKAHQGWVNDMDANSSFLVTCGWSPRQHIGSMLDPLARVYDLKTMMPLPPIIFHAGAAYVRMHPRMLTTGLIASRTGQLQTVDITNTAGAVVNVRQLNLADSYVTGMEIAPSGEALCFTDSTCILQLWGPQSQMRFTNYSEPTEFAAAPSLDKEAVDWNDSKPLNSIGLPYYRETLFSAWPGHMIFEVGAPTPKIDPAILSALTRVDSVSYAPNTRKTRRNQASAPRAKNPDGQDFDGPRFLSEQAKDSETTERRMSEVLKDLDASSLGSQHKTDVPNIYRNVEIKYSKFGVDDFDFEYYNKTRFSGLETHIPNSYANALFQLMRFTPVVRNLALHHTATPCLFESCMLCEMGFLFDMLEKAAGQNCHATNLLKTFSSLSSASTLGLLEEVSPKRPLTILVQATNRFLLEKISADYRQMTPQKPFMDTALTTTAVISIRCAHCGSETVRPGASHVHELSYQARSPTKPQLRGPSVTFSQVLKSSVERQEQTRGWCDRCKRYQQLVSQKKIQSIPPVLMINAAVHTPDAKQLWAKANWLPQEIGIIVEQGHFFCYEGRDLQHHIQRGAYKISIYELIGAVAEINSGDHQESHLVSMINVSPSLREKQAENEWHLFNDFLVRCMPVQEALRFDRNWKLPSVLTYQLKFHRHAIDDSWKNNLETSLLYRQGIRGQHESPTHFRTLSASDERPKPGMMVGIDAEFVALQQEEIEIRADGTRATLRPSRLALARVSVLRGGSTAPDNATALTSKDEQTTQNLTRTVSSNHTPFMDDYIHISDPITDYLTAYSGIHPGDLTPATSPHFHTGRLVSLKTAYKKLWLLLNLGVIFVGHGLPKDFRTINIHVPKAQVVDTVDLFFDKRRARKLSLRFLSWFLLGERVQDASDGKGGHDSVEDARMALRLWDKWRALEAKGKTQKTIDEIYRRGRDYGFKVPPVGDSPSKAFLVPGASTGASAMVSALGGASGVGTPSGRGTPSLMSEADGGDVQSTPEGKDAAAIAAETGVDES